jgi:hypothetical protein
MAMSSPFARPHTTSEWLRSSICWTVSCLGAWWLFALLINNVLPAVLGSLSGIAISVGFCVAHALIWRRGVAGGRAIIRHDEQHYAFAWTRLAANLWLGTLIFFQLTCLLGPFILIGLGLFSLLTTPAAPAVSSEPFFG